MKIDAVNIPRNSEAVTKWINTVVKRDIKKKHKRGHNNNKVIHGMRGGSKRTKRLVKRTKRLLKRTKKVKRA
jgi:hypothetical protein